MSRFPKKVLFKSDARNSLLRGINIVANSVSTTLGPKGKNVAINQAYGPPLIVHDGVTVAKSIDLIDPFEDMGAQLIKSAAQKTNDKAGDGTTTATIVAQGIINNGIEYIASGGNPMTLKDEIDEAVIVCNKRLKEITKQLTTPQEVEQIATVSSADLTIGKIVAEAVNKVGRDGVITVEEGRGIETLVEYKQGVEINKGFLSPQFITDDAKNQAIIEDPYILLTDKKINYNYEILPFLERFVKETGSTNLVIIAGEVLDEALATLVINTIRGHIKCVAIQAPSYGNFRVDELWDLAYLTGAKPILADSGVALETVQVSDLGRAGKVTVSKDTTVIIDGKGEKEAVGKRISDLKESISTSQTPYETDIRKDRLAKLVSGVAIIRVGAVTGVEVGDKKERVIDSVNATKAAVEDGIVAGGEITLLELSKSLKKLHTFGSKILAKSLARPFQVLIENAGYDYASSWSKVTKKKYPFGLDVMDGKVKNMLVNGIIDPVKVTKSALENAVSIATMTLTTDVVISEPIKDDK